MAALVKGLKRICMSCGMRFYDMGKNPIICPSCNTEFTGDVKVKAKRSRMAAIEEDDQVDTAEEAVIEEDEALEEDEAEEVSLDDLDEDDEDDIDEDIALDDDDIDLDDDIDDLDEDFDEDDEEFEEEDEE